MIDEICDSCHGTRLKPQREWITINELSYNSLGNMELYRFHYTRLHEPLDVPQQVFVRYLVTQKLHHPFMVKVVEKSLDVRINHPVCVAHQLPT